MRSLRLIVWLSSTIFILIGPTFQPSSYSCKKVPETRRPVSGPRKSDTWPVTRVATTRTWERRCATLGDRSLGKSRPPLANARHEHCNCDQAHKDERGSFRNSGRGREV